jgi:hypothetical protein
LEGKQKRRFSPHLVPELFRARYDQGYQKAIQEEKDAQQRSRRDNVGEGSVADGGSQQKNSKFILTVRGCSLKEGLKQAFPKDSSKRGTLPMSADEQQHTEETAQEVKKEGAMSTAWRYLAVGIAAGFLGGMIGMTMGLRKGMAMKTSMSSQDDSPTR